MKLKDDPQCELCRLDYLDPRHSEDEQAEDKTSIEFYGRCTGCYEEYGEDGYPDR